MVIDRGFWQGRRVLLTGHTGFKGAWMSLILRRLGAEVFGFSLAPKSSDDLFCTAAVAADVRHDVGDIRDLRAVRSAMAQARPEVVVHMAAQSLVQLSYLEPVETFSTNVTGTVHVLEAIRHVPGVQAALIVTSDKCYENVGSTRRYVETDAMGGHDPYSSSKGAAELVAAAYRRSFFHRADSPAIASCRAGNVFGGGDWALNRLVPDAMRAFVAGETLQVRNPGAVRPWQHVLDPLAGYLRLAQALIGQRHAVAEGWNFGPSSDSEVPVSTIATELARLWGGQARWDADGGTYPHEAHYLALDCSKAQNRLGWQPILDLKTGLRLTADWYRRAHRGDDVRALTLAQIDDFLLVATEGRAPDRCDVDVTSARSDPTQEKCVRIRHEFPSS